MMVMTLAQMILINGRERDLDMTRWDSRSFVLSRCWSLRSDSTHQCTSFQITARAPFIKQNSNTYIIQLYIYVYNSFFCGICISWIFLADNLDDCSNTPPKECQMVHLGCGLLGSKILFKIRGWSIKSSSHPGTWFVQGGLFNCPPPNISKCRPVSKFFQKKLEYPDCPPLKSLSVRLVRKIPTFRTF